MSFRLHNISKNFGEKSILENFSYDFPDLGVVAIIGDSGIGKTTLLRIIAGLDKDYSGEIIGIDQKISMAFQEHRLFNHLSVIENVVFTNTDTKDEAVYKKAEDLLLYLGFNSNDQKLYPHELSGGMKQRVSLCRAFLRNAPLLLLDEPTKELDKENVCKVIELIRENAKHRLIIIVTHDLSDIESLSPEIIEIRKY